MRTLVIILVVVSAAGAARAQDLVVSTSVTISSPATYDNVIVEAGGILTADAELTVLGMMEVLSGGVVTHSRYPTNGGLGLRIDVLDSLVVYAGGTIDVIGKGLRGAGGNGSAFGGSGEVYDSTGTTVVAGGSGGAGASYGGRALNGNVPYGLLEWPDHFGSGGSGCNYGGNGGGLVAIAAAHIVLDGSIIADGTNGGSCVYGGGGGGGSGGGVRLSCLTFQGDGSISARGGNGSNTNQTSGGGGRVAVLGDEIIGFDAETQIIARGGPTPSSSHNYAGSAGTIFVRHSQNDPGIPGNLIINNQTSTYTTLETPLMTELTEFDRLTIRDLGRLNIDFDVTFDHEVRVFSSAWLTIQAGTTTVVETGLPDLRIESASGVRLISGASLLLDDLLISGSSSRLENQSTLDLTAASVMIQNNGYVLNTGDLSMSVIDGTTLNGGSLYNRAMLNLTDDNVEIVSGSTLYEDASLTDDDAVNSVVIRPGGNLTHSRYPTNDGSGLRIGVADSLVIETGGNINVTGVGLRGAGGNGSSFGNLGEVYDPTGTTIIAGGSGGAGASYGGRALNGNEPYGRLEWPEHVGSGGSGCDHGGNGGGYVSIDAAHIVLDGEIIADGTAGGSCVYYGGGGGGSGGGVRLSCNTLSGSGSISARGGNGTNRNQTSGGGGRIAILADTITDFDAVVQATARGAPTPYSPNNYAGTAGTIFVRESSTDTGVPGHLIINNQTSSYTTLETPLMTDLSEFDRLTIRDLGRLNVDFDVAINHTVHMWSSSWLTIQAGTMTLLESEESDLRIESAAGVRLISGASLILDDILVTGSSSRLENYSELDLTEASVMVEDSGYLLNFGDLSLSIIDGTTLNGGSIYNRALLNLVDDNVTIVSGSTLYEDGSLTDDDQVTSIVVEPGGNLAHTRYPYNTGSGLRVSVLDSLVIEAGGSINVTGSGLRGSGSNGSAFGGQGEVYDIDGLNVVPGPSGSYGASYGGIASGGNAAYGLMENPDNFGSGGSGCDHGGNGGGLVVVSAQHIVLDGTIVTDGTSGGGCPYYGGGGGGSGGGVRLDCSTLTGSGSILARGGMGGNRDVTSGGGGRVAIFADSLIVFDVATQVSARGSPARSANYTSPGSAGTIFLQTLEYPDGYLIVDNSTVSTSLRTPLRTELTGTYDIRIASGEILEAPASHTQSGGTILLQSSTLYSPAPINLQTATLAGTGTVSASLINAGALTPGALDPPGSIGTLTVTGDLTFAPTAQYISDINSTTVHDQLNVGGALDLDGSVEIRAGPAYDPDPDDVVTVATSSLLSDEFADYTLPTQACGVSYTSTDVELVVFDYFVDIAVKDDVRNRAAVDAGATDTYDGGMDLLDMAAEGYVWFTHPEWGVPAGEKFQRDVRESFDVVTAVKTWPFTVNYQNNSASSELIEVEFSPSFTEAAGIGLILRDKTTGQTVNLFPDLVYTFYAPPYNRIVREFDLYIGQYGWTADDTDADGVLDSIDTCLGDGPAYLDRDGDGCVDPVACARHIEYWPEVDVPLHYVIHEDGAPGISDGSDFAAIEAGFDAWTGIPDATLGVVYDGTTPQSDAQAMDGVNLVTFDDPDWPFGAGVLAVGLSTSFTIPVWDGDTVHRPGQIIDADMIFNPSQEFRTASMGTGSDIQSVATHEAGHMFGLSHSSVVSSTMFYVLPPAASASELAVEDELAMLRSYPDEAALSGMSQLRGTVASGWDGHLIGGAIVFAIETATGDTLGCDYTLPDEGSYQFVGLPDGDYWVAIHPLDGSAEIGYIGPANINELIRDRGEIIFPAEWWDASESATDDGDARTPVAVTAGVVTEVDLVTNIDQQGPRILAVTPDRDAGDVPVDAAVLVKFTERVDPDSFRGQFNLSLTPGGALIPGNPGLVSGDSTLAYVPRENLDFSTTYYLTLGDEITDVYGNPLTMPPDSLQSVFTTQVQPAVSLSSLVPREGGVGAVVVVNGEGFDADAAANTVELAEDVLTVQQASATALVVAIPEGALLGTHQLTVTVDGETSNPLNFDVLELEAVPRGLGLAQADLPGVPRDLTVSPAGGAVFVATDAGLTSVDVTVPETPVASSLTVAGGLDAVVTTPTGGNLFAIGQQDRRLYRFQSDPLLLLSETAVSGEPLGLALSPGGRRAWIPTAGGEIQIWDLQLGSLTFEQQIGTLEVAGGNLVGPMTTDPAGERLLVLQGTGKLLVYPTDADTLLAEVMVGGAPRDVMVDPTGTMAYVTDLGGEIVEVSLSSYDVVGEIPTGGSLLGAGIKPTGTFLYAANTQLEDLDIIDLRMDSPTYRTVAGRVEHPSTPVEVAFSPDGLFAYSLATDAQALVVSATGEGPLLSQMTPQAGPVGAQVVLTGSGFTGGSVTFGGVTAPIVEISDTSLRVTVPAAATTGPVLVLGDEPTEVSNAFGFEVLDGVSGDMRVASTVQPAGGPALTAALAVSSQGNIAAVGAQDGRVLLLDIAPQSPTYNQFVAEDATLVTAIADLTMAPDGAEVWAAAVGDPQLRAYDTDPGSASFGTVVRTIDLGSGADPHRLALTPTGSYMLAADPSAATIHVIDLVTSGVSAVSLAGALPNLNGEVRALAVHPAGTHAFLAIGDDDPAAVLVLDIVAGTVVGSAAMPSGTPSEVPIAVSFAPDGNACYVMTSQETGTPNRTVVTLNSSTITAPTVTNTTALTVTGLPMDEVLSVSPAGDRLLLNIRDDGFHLVDLSTMTVTSQATSMPTGDPLDFGFTADGRRVFAVSTADAQVYDFDFLAAQRLAQVWGADQTGVIDTTLPTPLRVRIVDVTGGEGTEGVPVTFTVISGSGLLSAGGSPATTLVAGTDEYGYAQVAWTLGSTLGEQQVEVTASGAAGSPLTYTATAVEDASDQPLQLLTDLLAPPDGAIDVSVTSSVLASFSRAVDLESVSDSTFYLTPTGTDELVPAVIGLASGDRQASVTPILPLEYSTTYDLHTSDEITATDGSPLQNPTVTSLTTVAAPPSPVLSSLSVPGAQETVELLLSGQGFAPTPAENTVTFDGVVASVIEARTDLIRTRVPLGATSGPVQIEVGGQLSGSLPFSVLLPPPPPVDHVVRRLETGAPTRTAVVTPDGTLIYALAPQADLIKPINLQTFEPLPGIPVGDEPRALAIHPDGQHLYVANELSGDVSVIDIATGSPSYNTVTTTIPVGVGPYDLAVTPDGARIVVVNPGSSDLNVIDADPTSANFNQVISRVDTGSPSRTVAVTPDGTRVYVGTQDGYLILSSIDSGVIRQVSNGTASRAVQVSPDGTLLLIVDTQGGLSLFDIAQGSGREDQVIARPTSGTVVRTAAVSPDGTLIYVAQEDSNEILVFALQIDASVGVLDGDQDQDQALGVTELVQVASLTAGQDPVDIVFDPVDPTRFFVATAGQGSIDLFEAPAGPPPPVEELTVQALVDGNPGSSVFPLRISWPQPAPDVWVQLYRKGFGNYPEYDDGPDAGQVPVLPSTTAAADSAGWEPLSDTQALSVDDLATARDCWYYVAFARGPGGYTSGPSPMTPGTLNYLLGDVSDGATPGVGDNEVTGLDISALGSGYGTAEGDTYYQSWLDVGPTVDHDPAGRPLTDNLVEFEDLILFAINFSIVGRVQPPPEPVAVNALTLEVPALPAVGESFEVTVRLSSDGTLQGLSLPVSWNEDAIELLEHTAGALLAEQGRPVVLLSPRPGVFDVAVTGPRPRGLSGEGELLRLSFRVLATGEPDFALGEVKARSQTNEPVELLAEVTAAPDLPTAFALRHAYPNPFNPATRISFDLPRKEKTKLVIYDIAGRLVATLVDEVKERGAYTVIWRGEDDRGAAVASGVYFYRIVAGDFVATRKMTLLK